MARPRANPTSAEGAILSELVRYGNDGLEVIAVQENSTIRHDSARLGTIGVDLKIFNFVRKLFMERHL